MLKQKTREAAGEAAVHRVIKGSEMSERLSEDKPDDFSGSEVSDYRGRRGELSYQSFRQAESVIFC